MEDYINFCVCSCKFEAYLPEECPTNRDKKLRVANNVVLICPLELDITSSVLAWPEKKNHNVESFTIS